MSEESSSGAPPRFSITPEITEAVDTLTRALDRRKKLDDAVASAPGQITEAEAALQGLRSDLASKEVDVVWIDEAKLPALQREIARIESLIEAKEINARRIKARVQALESRAEEIDAEIEQAKQALSLEANVAVQSVIADVAEEIREKVKDLQLLYAKVRALTRIVPMDRTRDFVTSAYVPDLQSCMRVNTGTGYYDAAPNLLAVQSADTVAAEAEIEAVMQPITNALRAGRAHLPYVLLENRPQPYIRKGILLEAGAGVMAAQLAHQR